MDEMATQRPMTRAATRRHLEQTTIMTRSASRRLLGGQEEKNKKRLHRIKKSSSSGKSKAPKVKFKFRQAIFLPCCGTLPPSNTTFTFSPAMTLETYLAQCAGLFETKDDSPVTTLNDEQVCGLTEQVESVCEEDPNQVEAVCEEDPNQVEAVCEEDPNQVEAVCEEDPNHAASGAGGSVAPGIKGDEVSPETGSNTAPSSGDDLAPNAEGNVVSGAGSDAAPQI